ncbi:DinB family protein [Micromonospora sp. PLK6-60]|uniref:DinB family protein n=1 Tax=Micromonospora sp. PLK6-60 TaxID=2873383 RepID=UPI001CA6ABF6|nr:DinB family protein [Micromonospora sp. PLK6-60]MBY8873773.1 DinB family protein [Micromonospora sp. PLK6-60]
MGKFRGQRIACDRGAVVRVVVPPAHHAQPLVNHAADGRATSIRAWVEGAAEGRLIRQYGAMAEEFTNTDAFRGASFRGTDLSGATFRDCDLRQVRIVSSEVAELRVSGFGGRVGTVVIDDVDVTAFVGAELDRRYPERVQVRAIRKADDYREMWAILERLWSDTLAHAELLSETARQERVDGEWSFVETLRHLVFAIDVWVGRMLLAKETPYHRLGLPPTDYPAAGAAELGIDLDARPSYGEMVALHADRRAQTRNVLDTLTDAEMERIITAAPAPAWGVESHSAGDCLRWVMEEHCEHRRFAERDLALLHTR